MKEILQAADPTLLKNKWLVMKIVELLPDALVGKVWDKLDKEMKSDRKVAMVAVAKAGGCFFGASDEMRDDDENAVQRNTIRLGLGDFIFYSVLVSKAAQYSFATFAACMLVVLAGLGGTLILLAVYHHALPALPISILMGIIVYLTTRAFLEPFVEQVLWAPYYV